MTATRNSKNTKLAPRVGWLRTIGAWLAAGLCLGAPLVSRASGLGENAPPRDRGFYYSNDIVAEGPWSIHIVKISRSRPDLELRTTFSNGDALGMAAVSSQIKSLPESLGTPVAAINGDYFERRPFYEGRPRGLQIAQGELVSAPSDHPTFWVDPNGGFHMTNLVSRFRVTWPNGATSPLGLNEERTSDAAVLYTSVMGESTHTSGGVDLILDPTTNSPPLPLAAGRVYSTKVREIHANGDAPVARSTLVLSMGPRLVARIPAVEKGAAVRIETAITPDLASVATAISGGPTLIENGRAMEWIGIQPRHPRSAIGWNKNYYFLVEVDGRQRASAGMTLPELAAYLVQLGCEQAMNLDGGGSATLWAMGNVVNSPSEGKERPGPNSLVVVQKGRQKSKTAPDSR
jgi:hypothetical protein